VEETAHLIEARKEGKKETGNDQVPISPSKICPK
jgi:hypothetical protein